MYIGPEFLLGQVYDGSNAQEVRETVVLYRPVYVCVTRNNDCVAATQYISILKLKVVYKTVSFCTECP